MKRLLARIAAVTLPLLLVLPVPGRADHKNFTVSVKLQKKTSARIHKKNGRTMLCKGDFVLRHTIDAFRF